jgi:DNA-binding transcriptional regulator LsrR (DeoR family)
MLSYSSQLPPSSFSDYDSARLISRVLSLYYAEEKNQKEVAEILGLSVAKVNRLLKQAREQGWVEISIHAPFQNLFDLERRLQTACGIPEAVIVPELTQDPEAMLQTVGRAAAEYLLQRLRDGDTICISGGKALHAIVQAIETRRRYDVRVVPATGGVQGRHYTDVNYLAAQLADRLGGMAYQLHAPVFVDTPQERDTLLSMRQISEVLDVARQAQIALVGVGSVIPSSPSYFDLTSLGEADRRKIVEDEQGAGEILACLFNASGHPCAIDYNQRVVGLCLRDLRAVPLVIGVAATEQKTLPILGALRGKYLKTIIMDEAAALGVLELYERADFAGQPRPLE